MSTHEIPQSTLRAYRAAAYQVFDQPPFTLRVGQRSQPLENLYRQRHCLSAAFLTAWNPRSAMSSTEQNRLAQLELERALAAQSIPFIQGEGQDADRHWPSEASVLALGISLSQATGLAKAFDQNAFVWIGEDATPELVLLYPPQGT